MKAGLNQHRFNSAREPRWRRSRNRERISEEILRIVRPLDLDKPTDIVAIVSSIRIDRKIGIDVARVARSPETRYLVREQLKDKRRNSPNFRPEELIKAIHPPAILDISLRVMPRRHFHPHQGRRVLLPREGARSWRRRDVEACPFAPEADLISQFSRLVDELGEGSVRQGFALQREVRLADDAEPGPEMRSGLRWESGHVF